MTKRTVQRSAERADTCQSRRAIYDDAVLWLSPAITSYTLQLVQQLAESGSFNAEVHDLIR